MRRLEEPDFSCVGHARHPLSLLSVGTSRLCFVSPKVSHYRRQRPERGQGSRSRARGSACEAGGGGTKAPFITMVCAVPEVHGVGAKTSMMI